MGVRITQGMMFSSFNARMNQNLAALMESNMQGSSQKRINRPSDDPAGAARVMHYRHELASNAAYKSNVDDSVGWLKAADAALSGEGSVAKLLNRMMTLAEQGSSGTYDASNRKQIGLELREDFMQLIGIANTQYNGNSIFAGHKTNQAAYDLGIGVISSDESLYGQYSPLGQGNAEKTVLIQALTNGPASSATFRYSSDGGDTWQEASTSPMPAPAAPPPFHDPYPPDAIRVDAGGTSFIIGGDAYVTAVDPKNTSTSNNGSWFYLHPTGIYKGDDNDNQVMTPYGGTTTDLAPYVVGTTSPAGTIVAPYDPYNRAVNVHIDGVLPADSTLVPPKPAVVQYSYSTDGNTWIKGTVPDNGSDPIQLHLPGGVLELAGTPAKGAEYSVHPAAEGHFARDVAVRVDEIDGTKVKYSYSVDDGSNWTQVGLDTAGMTAPYRFPIPGGYANLAGVPAVGDQFIVHPHRADVNLDISPTDTITVNYVGKEVFGGVYQDPASGKYFEAKGMFDALGKLVAAAEMGSQHGMQEALVTVKDALKEVLTKAAVSGGRLNRINVTSDYLESMEMQIEDGLSKTEDVDVTMLMTKLAQQQLAYNSVLKSSSMVMQLSLVNFL